MLPEEGSSPLARGPRIREFAGGHFGGLIPARAGTTSPVQWSCHCAWAHPRSRGDHASLNAIREVPEGSSPLARGPLESVECLSGVPGLIPARAGTTEFHVVW